MIDLHQDLLLHVQRPELFEHPSQTSFEQLERAGVDVVVATAWPEPEDGDYLGERVPELIDQALADYATIGATLGWRTITDAATLRTCLSGHGSPGLLLHIEGINVLGDRPLDRLQSWHDRGVRSIGLTWNLSNQVCGGANDPAVGLTGLGREVLRWASTAGVVTDLAHISPAGFWDVLDIIQQPPVVSHTAARALHDHVRNLDDEQLRAIAACDGIIGLCVVPMFLDEEENTTIRAVVRHAVHIADTVGVAHLAIGTDFGGISKDTVVGCSSVDHVPELASQLRNAGFSDTEMGAILRDNAARVLGAILR